MILLNQFRSLIANGQMLKLLPKHPHVQRSLSELAKVFIDMFWVKEDSVHRPKVELSQILVVEVGKCKNDGCKILRRIINLVSSVEEVEAELVAGELPLLVSHHRNGQSYNERCDRRKIGWFHKVLNYLQNVKGVARRRLDVQSEANEGRYPPLPLPSCSASSFSLRVDSSEG
jgi:hypothetical protein